MSEIALYALQIVDFTKIYHGTKRTSIENYDF